MSSTLGYRNPIIPGFNPDPTILRVGKDYFICTSTFEYFPGLPIYHSTDLVNWKLISHGLNRRSQLDMRVLAPGMGILAPTLRYHKGRFYLTSGCIYKLFGPPGDPLIPPRGFYVWSDDIFNVNGWSDPIYYDVTGIDQDLFFDTDDRVYLSIAKPFLPITGPFSMGIHTCEIDITTGKSLSLLQLNRRTHIKDPIAEGPHIYKRGSYYYLSSAEGGTESHHQQWVQRSSVGPYGPWEVGQEGVINPMVYNGDDRDIRQTGHMDWVEGHDGRWWAVFLGVRPRYEGGELVLSQLGRETFMCEMKWVDDWPVVNGRKVVKLDGDAALGLTRISPPKKREFSFGSSTDLFLDGWYHLRTPIKSEHSQTLRANSLALFGGPYELRTDENVTLLLQKQTSFLGTWETTVDFESDQVGCTAGTTVWWSKWAFAAVFVRIIEAGREVVVVYPNPEGDDFKEAVVSAPNGPVTFRVNAHNTSYDLGILSLEGQFQSIQTISSRVLVRTRSFDSIMTGTHFGIFATGSHGQSSLKPAFFSGTSWESKDQW